MSATTTTMYGPQPEARKERAITAMKLQAVELARKLEAVHAMTPEQFEMELRLQLVFLTSGINEYHEAVKEEVMVRRRMRKAGWLW